MVFSWPGHSKYHRSEEHTSELQSLTNLVCRLLLEKKKEDPRIAQKISIEVRRDHKQRLRATQPHDDACLRTCGTYRRAYGSDVNADRLVTKSCVHRHD